MPGEDVNLAKWLDEASTNDRTLTETWSVCKAWKEGAMPRDVGEMLMWARVLARGKRRTKRLMKSSDELISILAAKLVASGLSGREVGRALAIPPSTMERMVARGQEITRGRTSDG